MARYLYLELSINDGTKEPNQIPNMAIFPVIIGHESHIQLPSQAQYDKCFSYYSPNKKKIYNRIKEISYYEPNNDKKRLIIEYNDERNKISKQEEKKSKSNDSELLSLYNTLNSNCYKDPQSYYLNHSSGLYFKCYDSCLECNTNGEKESPNCLSNKCANDAYPLENN